MKRSHLFALFPLVPVQSETPTDSVSLVVVVVVVFLPASREHTRRDKLWP